MLRNSGPISLPANAALGPYVRVKLTAGYLALAGAADDEIGTLAGRILAGETSGAVIPLGDDAVLAIAAGAISQFADVYRAASGKLSATPNGQRWGIALEAAAADGDQFAVLHLPGEAQARLVEAHTADDTLTAAEMYGSIHTSVGATGTVVLALPAAVVGMHGQFRVGAAQELRLDPNGTEKISLPSTGVPGAAGKYLTANADGETVALVCTKAGEWSVMGYTGTWTAEA
jgi:hypothetical protein